ncbi:sensor histidine kinase [Rheinheimera salexigens]|uniref:Transcriptional regulator n=2 Tax=Rheinheimera salexigens TaxID=1628148 RepID=A0A1E7Q4V6_9GAMM|nr:transcriptional regulator [Rheinheimera salexigens]
MQQAKLQPRIHFGYWHLLYWLSYLLVKYTHLTILVPLQDESAWPYLWIYSLITLINIIVTGMLAQHELKSQRPLFNQLQRLLLVLIPLCCVLVVLRQSLVMSYATTALNDVDSILKYATAFMLVLLPIAGWLAVFMLIKANQLHLSGLLQQQRLIKKARQAQLKVLRYQLNPHFMFNTLNALNTLIIEHNGAAAEQLIGHLSTYLRHSLTNQHDQFIPLQQELDALYAYMAIQQVRFGQRLHLDWQIPQHIVKVRIPPLLLHPLAENAIQYSVAERAGKIELNISIELTQSTLTICLAQPSASAEDKWPQQQYPTNLLNLAQRLELLFGTRANLLLANSDNGFFSQITLPREPLDDSA